VWGIVLLEIVWIAKVRLNIKPGYKVEKQRKGKDPNSKAIAKHKIQFGHGMRILGKSPKCKV
jgi:hypothetical protein